MAERAHFQRGHMLLQQGRVELAEQEFRAALSQDPEDPYAHAMLAVALTELDRISEAMDEAQMSVAKAPDLPLGYHALAQVHLKTEQWRSAEAAIQQALALDPHDVEAFATLAGTYMGRRRWKDALEAAEKGLQIDPHHAQCANLRATCLVHLGRRDEAAAALGTALSQNPEDAMAHANQGWGLLHNNEPRQAMDHFREALRLSPGLEYARVGLVEAIKARNPIYRVMLMWFLWLSRFTPNQVIAIIVGLFILQRVVVVVQNSYPALAVVTLPALYLYLAFAVMTWLANPLFNLLLRLHPLGRHALDESEKWCANIVGVLVAFALLNVALIFVPVLDLPTIAHALLALGACALVIPVQGIFAVSASASRWKMGAVTAVLLGLGAMAAWMLFTGHENTMTTFNAYLIGCWLSSMVAHRLP